MKKNLLIISILVVLFSSCDRGTDQSIRLKQQFTIPEADVVFNTISEPEKGEAFGKNVIGFYSTQDRSVSIMEFPDSISPIRPYYLNADTIMVLNKLGNFGLINEGQAYLSIISNTQYLGCRKLVGDVFFQSGGILFYSYMESISIINYHDCSLEKTLLNSDDLSALQEYSIGLRSFSADENYVLGSKDLQLFKINLSNREMFDYKRVGFSPALSPDQKKIAYLALDGIHIMDVNGQNDILVVPYEPFISYSDGSSEIRMYTPDPNWSSDSTKIVYHKCILPYSHCNKIGDYGIFIFDIVTMSEEMIVKGGLNPSWNHFK